MSINAKFILNIHNSALWIFSSGSTIVIAFNLILCSFFGVLYLVFSHQEVIYIQELGLTEIRAKIFLVVKSGYKNNRIFFLILKSDSFFFFFYQVVFEVV